MNQIEFGQPPLNVSPVLAREYRHGKWEGDAILPDRSTKVIPCEQPSFGAAAGLQLREHTIEIDQHHDAGFGGNACERNEADGDGDG